MQLYKEDWPKTSLSEEERLTLIDKVENFVNDYDNEDLCEACRKNTFCLAFAGSISAQILVDDYDVSLRTKDFTPEQAKYHEILENRIETLIYCATYIQSRTSETYYGHVAKE